MSEKIEDPDFVSVLCKQLYTIDSKQLVLEFMMGNSKNGLSFPVFEHLFYTLKDACGHLDLLQMPMAKKIQCSFDGYITTSVVGCEPTTVRYEKHHAIDLVCPARPGVTVRLAIESITPSVTPKIILPNRFDICMEWDFIYKNTHVYRFIKKGSGKSKTKACDAKPVFELKIIAAHPVDRGCIIDMLEKAKDLCGRYHHENDSLVEDDLHWEIDQSDESAKKKKTNHKKKAHDDMHLVPSGNTLCI